MVKILCSLALALSMAVSALGGTEPRPPFVAQPVLRDVFAKGNKEFQNLAGAFYFFDRGGNDRATLDYAVDSLRLGFMLSNPHSTGFFAGNSEFLAEIFGGPIFQGAGHVAAGATIFIRYNFIQPHCRVIPYFQIGAGGVYTDVSEEGSHGLISLPVEFNLQGGGGLRFMLNRQWSLLLEVGYRHISNASIKLPNGGVDSFGGALGFGFFF